MSSSKKCGGPGASGGSGLVLPFSNSQPTTILHQPIDLKTTTSFEDIFEYSTHDNRFLVCQICECYVLTVKDAQTHYLAHLEGGSSSDRESCLKREVVSVEKSGWNLPGSGDKKEDCGELRFKGCTKVDQHYGTLRNPNIKGKVYVEGYYRSCDRRECPICYENWASRRAKKITFRLLSFCAGKKKAQESFKRFERARRRAYLEYFEMSGEFITQHLKSLIDEELWDRYIEREFKGVRYKPIHVIYSVPENLYDKSIEYLRRKCYEIAKKTGVFGGSVVFHPKRFDDESGEWYFSPHFHALVFGWVVDADKVFKKTGWVTKNLGIRKSVLSTAFYQLSHCGIHPEYHSYTWFGALSYNKFTIFEMPKHVSKCPLCGSELVKLDLVEPTDRPPPELIYGAGVYLCSVELFQEVRVFR